MPRGYPASMREQKIAWLRKNWDRVKSAKPNEIEWAMKMAGLYAETTAACDIYIGDLIREVGRERT